jgi:hypothetical protein
VIGVLSLMADGQHGDGLPLFNFEQCRISAEPME